MKLDLEGPRSAYAAWLTNSGPLSAIRLLPVISVVLTFLIMWPAAGGIYRIWREDYGLLSHGPLVFSLVLWLVWRQGPMSDSVPIITAAAASTALLVLGWFAQAGAAASAQFVPGLVLPIVVLVALVGLFGWGAVRRYGVPVGFLYFAMPVWDPLEYQMMWPATVALAPKVVGAFGIPLRVHEQFVYLRSGVFEIAPKCSGTNYVLVGLLLAGLIGHLWRVSTHRAIALAVGGAFIAFLANIVRITTIIALGHYSDMTHPWVNEHAFLGWWVFASIFAVCLWLLIPNLGNGTSTPEVLQCSSSGQSLRHIAIIAMALGIAPAVGIATEDSMMDAKDTLFARIRSQVSGVTSRAPVGESIVVPMVADVDIQVLAASHDGGGGSQTWYGVALTPRKNTSWQRFEMSGSNSLVEPMRSQVVRIPNGGGTHRAMEGIFREANGNAWVVRRSLVVEGVGLESVRAAKVALLKHASMHGAAAVGLVATATRCATADCVEAAAAADQSTFKAIQDLASAMEY